MTGSSALSGDLGGDGKYVSDDSSYEGLEASSNHRFRTVGSGKDRNAQVNDQVYHRPGPDEESHEEIYDEGYEAEDEDDEEEEWETWIDWSLCSKGTLLGED